MIAAGVGAAGSLLGGLFSSGASKDAAKTQANATNYAATLQAQSTANALAQQKSMFDTSQANLSPFIATGSNASNMLTNALTGMSPDIPVPVAPGKMTQAELEQTPGYQFNLSQGLKGVQNSASARGLGISGAAQKGAAAYATGLADSTYQNQFNNQQAQFGNQQTIFNDAQANRQNLFNRLYSTAALGSNAASGLASNATQTGNSMAATGMAGANGIANTTMTGANGQAAAQTAAGTAFNPLLNNLGSYYQMAQGNGLYGGGTSGLTGMYNGGR